MKGGQKARKKRSWRMRNCHQIGTLEKMSDERTEPSPDDLDTSCRDDYSVREDLADIDNVDTLIAGEKTLGHLTDAERRHLEASIRQLRRMFQHSDDTPTEDIR
ncbi:hypothetical protein ACKVMT_05295 [Halobacteriales archaeon Cl-PHB]